MDQEAAAVAAAVVLAAVPAAVSAAADAAAVSAEAFEVPDLPLAAVGIIALDTVDITVAGAVASVA